MFMKAFMPATKVVPAAGIAYTVGSPNLGYPFGWASIPAKMVASNTEMKVKNAERVASFASVSKVLGREQTKDTTAIIAEKPIVQTVLLVIVLRYFAPTRQ
jgi:hypothetical protein